MFSMLVCCMSPTPIRAQEQAADRVIVRRETSRRQTTYTGRVLDYTNKILRFRLQTSGGVRQFKTSEILSIATPQVEQHQQGAELFKAGKYQEAVVALEAATRNEPRDWVRRDILALLAQVHLRHGNRIAAADAFVRLTNSDPNTHHFASIPLWWSDDPIDAAGQRKARTWLSSPNLSAQLIGASALFQFPETRAEAVARFEKLARSGRAQVIDLARTQQWRTRLTEDKPFSDVEIKSWRGRLQSMESAQRAGPWFLLGQAYSKRREHDQSALAYLWVPLVYSEDWSLAAEANFAAAGSLEKAGRLPEAESLYRETSRRFQNTRFAERAEERLRPRKQQPPSSTNQK